MFIICSLAVWLQLVHPATVAMALDHCRNTIRYNYTEHYVTSVYQLVSICAYAQRYHDIRIICSAYALNHV